MMRLLISLKLIVCASALASGRCRLPTPSFAIRPACVDDLGAAVALLVSAFFEEGSVWFPNICVRELSRLKENFPSHQHSHFSMDDTPNLLTMRESRARPSGGLAAAGDRGFHAMLVAELEEEIPEEVPQSTEKREHGISPIDAAVKRARLMAGFVDLDFRPPKVATRDDPPRPYLTDLAVCATQRRKGIGRALLEACESLVELEGWRLYCLLQSQSQSQPQFQSQHFNDNAFAAQKKASLFSDKKEEEEKEEEEALFSPQPCDSDPSTPMSFSLQFPLKLYLKADRSNAGAMGLYRSLGYELERTYLSADIGGNDKVLLSKVIAHDPTQLSLKCNSSLHLTTTFQ